MSRAVVHKPTGKSNRSQFYCYRHEIFIQIKSAHLSPTDKTCRLNCVEGVVGSTNVDSLCSLRKYSVLNPIFFLYPERWGYFQYQQEETFPSNITFTKAKQYLDPRGKKEVFSMSLRRPPRLFILDFLFLLYQFSDTRPLPLANKHVTLMSPEQQEVLGKHGLLSRESLGFVTKINFPLLASILFFSLTFHSQISSIVCALRILWLRIAPSTSVLLISDVRKSQLTHVFSINSQILFSTQ